jgi:dTDP-4-dehydrorhamnose 3,5-epimerase
MIFTETPLQGAYCIDVEKHEDVRGFFGRSWCINEFGEHGLSTKISQCNISLNHKKGTLRGIHFQTDPFEEVKLVRCTRGVIFDVMIDLRKESKTFLKWFGTELSANNYRMLYVPKRFAHGFQTLEDNSEVFYQMEEIYSGGHARGMRWDDPAFQIKWPQQVTTISERDRTYPDFTLSLLNGL